MGAAGGDFRGSERFHVLGRLGAGGMGVVYEVLDRARGARLALKTLRKLSPEGLARFKNEFRALADLHHPNLASLGELVCEGGQWFFTMELVRGVSFLEYVRTAKVQIGEGAFAEGDTIAGAPLPRSAPAPSPTRVAVLDEARLRDALGQLALGLAFLHGAGKIHRDIKPSNVLVTATGRTVLLDFGLVTEVLEDPEVVEGRLVGTPDYIAPEQAAVRPVGPAADWYSVGVVLYQALAGRRPFPGSVDEVLRAKQEREPPPPSSLEPGVAADLDRLCVDLLRREPGARPDGREVLRRLGVTGTVPELGPGRAPFVGRQPELATLRAALDEARRGVPGVVLVQGESGVGKTVLVQRFVGELRAADATALALTGRCHERESVPFKAIDGILDALARALRERPPDEVAAVLPDHVGLLAQVFPVLRRVDAIAELAAPPGDPLDPQELRRRMFTALRRLLEALARRGPLVLVIDDLQWADADSLAMMASLTAGRDAGTMLVVATVRTSDAETLSIRLADSGVGPEQFLAAARRLEVGRLGREEAGQLAALRVVAHGGLDPDAVAQDIAAEAGGHPLFIDELARSAVAAGDSPAPLRLDEALWMRARRLEAAARRVLELVAVAGLPWPLEEIADAGALDRDALERQVAVLRAAQLARTSDHDTIECYHDRVRESVVAHLDGPSRRACHARLAAALAASGRDDPEVLAFHYEGAGERERAAVHAVRAAEKAEAALAFEHAARLYGRALQLGGHRPQEILRLERRRADVLAAAGRGAEAARAYQRAAASASGDDVLALEQRAAEQLLRAGHIDEGLVALRRVLGVVSLGMPESPRGALVRLVLRRAQLRLRGLRFEERALERIDPAELLRIDLCWSAGFALGMVDNVRGTDFQTKNLLLALRAGEPYRIARALALEACYASVTGDGAAQRSARLLRVAGELCERIENPHALAWLVGAAAFVAYQGGRFRSAHELSRESDWIMRSQCTGVAWERNSVEMVSVWSLYYLGWLGDLASRVPVALDEALDRGDLYAVTNLRTGLANSIWLAEDDPGRARAEATAGLAAWSRQGFHLQHYWSLLAQAQIDLYGGDGRAAWARLEAGWAPLSRSFLLRVQSIRVEALFLRARAALAASLRSPGLLAAAERDARRIARERVAWASPLAATIHGLVAERRGDAGEAVRRLAEAVAGFEAVEMALHAAAARRRLGLIEGGAAGSARLASAEAWMAGQGVRQPARMANVLLPAPE